VKVHDMTKRVLSRLFLAACLTIVGWAARAAQPPDVAAHCTAMKQVRSLTADGLRISIVNAAITKVYDDLPEVCQVEGYVAPTVGFKIALPVHGWNGKYIQGGCGGACGTTKLFWCDEPLTRGYACLNTDMGHTSSTADWDWSFQNLQGKVDFGFRSTHLAALIGPAVAGAYYGAPPSKSYFMGCSTGGRQGLLEAEMFPTDFDGIIAGAPPLNEIGSGMELAWNILSNTRHDGSAILTEADVRLLHQAVVDACDMNDGVKDGLIGNPRQCKFDIAALQCGTAKGAHCLSAEKIGVARKLYAGPTDQAGHPVNHQGGVALGSELNWLGDYVATATKPPQYSYFIQEFMRYMAFNPQPGAAWKLTQLDYDRDPQRTGESEMLFSATNPDLRDFKAHGGKMISFQGLADTSVVPFGTLDYYDEVTRLMGGAQTTQDFYRLFTIPGGRHCSSDGAGAEAVNWIEVLERWVEKGEAPTQVLGHHYDFRGPVTRALKYPLDPARVGFTRPIYLYPKVAHYIGHGDQNDAANYVPGD
jgi:hypothetical protein